MAATFEIDIHDRPTLPGPPPRIDTASEAFFAFGEVAANDVEPTIAIDEDAPAVLAHAIRRAFLLRFVGVVCAVCAVVLVAALLA